MVSLTCTSVIGTNKTYSNLAGKNVFKSSASLRCKINMFKFNTFFNITIARHFTCTNFDSFLCSTKDRCFIILISFLLESLC